MIALIGPYEGLYPQWEAVDHFIDLNGGVCTGTSTKEVYTYDIQFLFDHGIGLYAVSDDGTLGIQILNYCQLCEMRQNSFALVFESDEYELLFRLKHM